MQKPIDIVSIAGLTEGLWYLASPYSHPNPDVREARFQAVARVAGLLYKQHNIKTFCPIAHTHPIEQALVACGEIPEFSDAKSLSEYQESEYGYKFWLPWDFEFFPHLRGMLTTCLPGWEMSKGIAAEEVKMAQAEKRVLRLDPKEWFSRGEWEDLKGAV